VILADAIAVTAIARDPAAVAAGRAYRVLAEMAPAIEAALSVNILRLPIAEASKIAETWAKPRGLAGDLADTLAEAMPQCQSALTPAV
jgi:hypothetical protein